MPGAADGVDGPEQINAERRARVNAMYAEYRELFPGLPELAPADVADGSSDLVIVDARTPEEMAVSRIPRAISREAFEAHSGAYEDTPVAVYCTIGYRSGLYAEELRRRGFNAHNLRGSLLGWVHEGRPVVDAAGEPVKRLHVYGRRWDLAPVDYTAEW
jgi:rhodanese-related sulfurtransferase